MTFTTTINHESLPVHITWSENGIERINLVQFAAKKNSLPPKELVPVIEEIKRYLDGKKFKFDDTVLNWSKCTPFQKKVYKATKNIPSGKTLTYSEVAAAIGKPKAVRAVGTALGKNPWPLIIPCHRVVAKGNLGGFSAPGGLTTKKWLLALENI